ncbi:MAG: serine/threonine-protein kinase [Planctomycetota bacterium]
MSGDSSPGDEPADLGRDDAADALIGLVLGDCTLRSPLGRGGMGVVYEGWQDPPGRQVAVKMLGDALASPEARLRFRQEARVLGSLRHPAIAQIHRVGTHKATTELSYFVMEYVADAVPITEYVRRHELGLEAALRLMVDVCRGVHAGHVRGVIHRDLKPGNVLVGSDGHPKVIDFGVARLTGDDDSPDTPRTRTAHLMGTVRYMSPEQLGGHAESVDTRSDVYALGVLLYEVLTGTSPYDLANLGLMETIGAIRHQPPRAPERFHEGLPRDVGIIVRKALAKDPDARYGSAEALADDLERFLEARPILARPPSMAYQVRLYARRHRVAFLAMIGGLVSLIASLVVISLFATSEARARKKAERDEARARSLLNESAGFIPEITDHLDNKLGAVLGATRVRRLLAEKVEGLAERLAAVPGVSEEPVVLRALAAAELSVGAIKGGATGPNLGDEGEAVRYYERAIEHLEKAHAARPGDDAVLVELVSARLTLALQHRAAGRLAEVHRLLAEARPVLDALAGRQPGNVDVTSARLDFLKLEADTSWSEEAYDAALQAYQQHIELAEQLDWEAIGSERHDRFLLQAQLDLATCYEILGRSEEAAPHLREVDRLAQRIETGELNHTRLWLLWHVQDKLGDLAFGRRDYEAALSHHQRALAIAEQLVAADAEDDEALGYIHSTDMRLAVTLERMQRFDEASSRARSALSLIRSRRERQPDNRNLEWDERLALTRLGSILDSLGSYDEGRRLLQEALDLQEMRVQRSGSSPEELCGLSEVESTLGWSFASEGEAATDGAVKRASFESALAWFDRARERLLPLREHGGLTPGFDDNIDMWQRAATWLREQLAQLDR